MEAAGAGVLLGNDIVSSDEAIMSTAHVRRAYTRLHAAGLRVGSADKAPKAHEMKTILQLCAREQANLGTLLCQPRTSARVPLEILSVVAVEVNKWVEAARKGDAAAIERRRASTTLVVVPTCDDVPRWFHAARTYFPVAATTAGAAAPADKTTTTMQVAGILLAGVLAPGDTYAVDGTTLVQRGRPTAELLDAYDVLIIPQIVLQRLMGVPALCAEYDAIMARVEKCVRGETTYGAVCSSVEEEEKNNGAFMMHKNHDREAPLYFRAGSTRLPALFARQWHRVVVDDAHEVLAASLRSTTSRALFALRATHWCGITEQAQRFDTNATMAWAMLVRLLQIATFVPLHVLLEHWKPPAATDPPRRHAQHDKIRQWCTFVVDEYQMEVAAPAEAARAVVGGARVIKKEQTITDPAPEQQQSTRVVGLQSPVPIVEKPELTTEAASAPSLIEPPAEIGQQPQQLRPQQLPVHNAAMDDVDKHKSSKTRPAPVTIEVTTAVQRPEHKNATPTDGCDETKIAPAKIAPVAPRRRGRPDDDDDDDDDDDYDVERPMPVAEVATARSATAASTTTATEWRPAAGRIYDCPFFDEHACTFEDLLRHARNPHKEGTEPDPVSVKVHTEFLCQIADGASYETACLMARLHFPPRSSRTANRPKQQKARAATVARPTAPKHKNLIKAKADDDDDDDENVPTDETLIYNDADDDTERAEEDDDKPTCMCRKPWEMVPGLMIECSACAEWFHVTCLRAHGDVPKQWREKHLTRSNVVFVCSTCNKASLGTFVDKRSKVGDDDATKKKKKKRPRRDEPDGPEADAEAPAKRAKKEEEAAPPPPPADIATTVDDPPTATFPLHLNSRQTVLSLGAIPDRARKAFFTERYVYPIGYRSLYRHKGNVYVCEILDGKAAASGKDRPVFRVRRGETTGEWHTSATSTAAVTAAVAGTSTARRSGPEFFSLSHDVVQRLLQQAMRKRQRPDDTLHNVMTDGGDGEKDDVAAEPATAAAAAAAAAAASAAAAAAAPPPSRVAKLDQRVAERVCKAFSSMRTVRKRVPGVGGGAHERTLDIVYVDHVIDFATRIERNFHDACLATTSTRGTTPPAKRLKMQDDDGAADDGKQMAEQEVFAAMLATISVSALRAQRGDDFLAHNQVVRNGLATKALPTVSTKLAEMVRYVQQRVRDGERAIVLSEWHSTLVELEKALVNAKITSAMHTGDDELDAAPKCLLVPVGADDMFGDSDTRLPPAHHILFAHPLLDAQQSDTIVRNIAHPLASSRQFVVHFMIADTCDELVRHHATNVRLDRHGVLAAVADDLVEQQCRADRAASVRGVARQ